MKSKSGLLKSIEVLLNENLMTSLMVPMMTCLWDFVHFLYLASSMILLKSLMDILMVPMTALLWIYKWKLYLAYLIVLTKANMMAPSMVLGTCHT